MQWAGLPQPPSSQAYGAPQPTPAVPQPNPIIPPKCFRGPRIPTWLQYCDRHPGRDGEIFFALAEKFDGQGYRTIDQLTGDRMSIENLSNWLEIGKGTADLIIHYAEEDMAMVRDGNFTMNLEPAPVAGLDFE